MEADAFTALRGLRDRAEQYDLICLDPPKLANTEGQVEKASRAYKDLNLLAIKLLAPGGRLLTWSCSGAMTVAPNFFCQTVCDFVTSPRPPARTATAVLFCSV